jgi:hypothetical protein
MERGLIVSAIGLTIIGGAWLFSRRLAAEIETVFGPPFAEPFGDWAHLHGELAALPLNSQAGSGHERGSAAVQCEDRTLHKDAR